MSKTVSKAAPREATQKLKQLQQKAKQLPQKAKQVGRQAGRAAQQAAPGGFKGALKDQDTLANLGAAALVGLGVLAASSVTLGGGQAYCSFTLPPYSGCLAQGIYVCLLAHTGSCRLTTIVSSWSIVAYEGLMGADSRTE